MVIKITTATTTTTNNNNNNNDNNNNHLTMKITRDASITQEIQCSYLGIVLSKM